ncbi:MAG: hypothetical protein L3J24_03915 [Xanthomonadales bacterium]|nr:hypothetical protein [Xanthomonadales bacterium]
MERESKELTGEGPDQLNQLFAEYSKLNQDIAFATEHYGKAPESLKKYASRPFSNTASINNAATFPFLPFLIHCGMVIGSQSL